MTLAELQREHAEWLAHNFPNQLPVEPFLGLVEEIGELSHALLKHGQSIRGYDDQRFRADAADAIGDFVIYLASFCNSNGFDLQLCVDGTWNKVKERDWRKDPTHGNKNETNAGLHDV